MNNKIIILYKDKSYGLIKESKLYKAFNNRKEIKYLLFQSLNNPLIFYPILPDKRLISNHFVLDLAFDISKFDFDMNSAVYLDTITSHYETDSVSEFIEYLSIFYKINGVSSEIESATTMSDYTVINAIYPIYYHISFGYMNEYEDIDSGRLERIMTPEEVYDSLPTDTFVWLTEDRMSNLSSILLIPDIIKNSSFNLPIFMRLRDDTWSKIKKYHQIDNEDLNSEDILLVKANEFNSYYLTTYKDYNKLTKVDSFPLNIIITSKMMIENKLYSKIINNLDNENQINRDALCKYIKDDYAFIFDYIYSISDSYSFITWQSFIKDIINYMIALYKKEVDEMVIIIRHNSTLINYTFTYNDIISGKFQKYLAYYINEKRRKI